jgi:hypothetical protein
MLTRKPREGYRYTSIQKKIINFASTSIITIFIIITTTSSPQALQQQKASLEEDSKSLRAELESLQAATTIAAQESTLLAASQQEAIDKVSEARKSLEILRASEMALSKEVASAAEEHNALAVREAQLQARAAFLRFDFVMFFYCNTTSGGT